ncbi:hypothetical protein VP01_1294g1 [Puccinia sorghi]|uniref:Reverse transcriptase Ty1/copia-type domain-containing protein n=1 Tax=Puccinia sorghi TaxID=27349 RepID=A0A0L6VNH1_9BASI|nr:hypothetical protein VP01_1294g1 [Puccinia sorghi]
MRRFPQVTQKTIAYCYKIQKELNRSKKKILPSTIESAICCSESFLWIKAIDSEFDSIEGHEFTDRFSNSACHPPNTLFGMKFERVGNKICLSQPKHINHGLEELGLTECKPSSTPLTPNLQLREASDDDHNKFKRLNINYRSAIGLLNYITSNTRPDLSFAVNSRRLGNTFDVPKTSNSPLNHGYLCFLFGSLISCNSCQQRSITYSSTEAKLNPLVESFHKGVWLKALINEMWKIQIDSASHFIDEPDPKKQLTVDNETFKKIFCINHLIDNKGLNDKLKKFGSNAKTRHIDLRTKGIQQEIKERNIKITLIKTQDISPRLNQEVNKT